MRSKLMLEAFEIVQQTWDLPGDERQAAVEGRCAGRPELLEAVERIESAPVDEDFDQPLERAIDDLLPEMLAAAGKDELVDTVVGPYRVGKLLGEGGMGRVYRAVHLGHGGEVALKVMRLRLHRGTEEITRLRREASLLARCHHPGIVQIHHLDAMPDGGIYFTMELVEGLPLVDYCATESMSLKARLRLFLQVCEAVDAAHNVGVIHRDLKPSNILASRVGVKLLDFGVAEAFGGEETGCRAYISAPYAAPEHLDETTVRTDVYSMGVLLGEVLLNRLPFREGASPAVTAGWVTEGGRPPLRSLADEVTAPWLRHVGRLQWSEIEAICNRAMQSDPAMRYGAVRELAADVRQLLEGRPVAALREGKRVRASLYVALRTLRHHAVATGIAAAMLVLGATSLTEYLHALHASQKVAQNERHTEEQRQRQQDLMQSLLWNTDGSVNSQIMTTTLLERAVHQAQVIALDPEQKAGLYKTFGVAFQDIRDFPRAESLFRESLALNSQIYGADSAEAADNILNLANLKCTEGNPGAGVVLARQARANLVRRLAATAQPVLDADVEEAQCLVALGDYRGARPLLENAVQQENGRPEASAVLSVALNDLSSVEDYQGHYQRSIGLQQQSMAIDRLNEGPRHPDIGEHLLSISDAYSHLGDAAEATRAAREALDILSSSLGPDHHDVLAAERQLADSLMLENNYAEADAVFDKALAGLEREGKDSQTEAVTLLQYADSLRDQGKLREALEKYGRAFDMVKRLFPAPDHFWAASYFGLAATYSLMGEQVRAETTAREAVRLDRELFGTAHVSTLQANVLMARILLKENRVAEARALLEQCKQNATGSDPATREVFTEANELLQAAAS